MSIPNRRFLVIGGVLVLVMGLSDASASVGSQIVTTARTDVASSARTSVGGVDLDSTTIPELQALMDGDELSSLAITRYYKRRIERLNPKLHAVITVSPTARSDARAADRARNRGVQKPLLGIPVLVKDNINTTGMPTTAGSFALQGSTPANAFIVRRMKAAGAIILGKANLSEWANVRSSPSSSGWSALGGQTNLAYVLSRNPCGSSSGSGVGASANLATVTVGTETNGSIVCPSGANGIVGIKPTVGLASRTGLVPVSADQDTSGPMARNVTDAAVLLGALTGVDEKDPATADQVGHVYTDYTQFLDPNALDGARIGVWRNGTYNPALSPEITEMLNATIDTLEAQGATVVDNTTIFLGAAGSYSFQAILCEFKSDIANYLGTYTGPGYPKSLLDVINFNNDHPELEGPWNNYIFELSQATGGRDDPACAEAREKARSVSQNAVDGALARNDLDAIIAPTNGPAWVTDPVDGDHGGDWSASVGSSGAAAIAGYASITVPAAYFGQLPLGISFIGTRWDEPKLIGFGYAFENATQVRVPPRFLSLTHSGELGDIDPPPGVRSDDRPGALW